MTKAGTLRRRNTLDLKNHHALCEMNFHMLLCLLPGLKQGVEDWSIATGENSSPYSSVRIQVMETCPYTTTIGLKHIAEKAGDLTIGAMLNTPKIVVRLYHDVSMAEIIAWDKHRHWKPEYAYPNDKMYHPDEKIALNQFLSDWLSHYKNEGRSPTQIHTSTY